MLDNYIDGDEFLRLTDSELHSLVNALGPYKKIKRLIPSLTEQETSKPGKQLQQLTSEQALRTQTKKSLSLVSNLKQAKASVFTKKTVSSLFSSNSSKGKSKRTFEPSADLIVSDEKRKKKSARPKPVSITVIILPTNQGSVPKGKQRNALEKCGRIKKVPIYRHATDPEVEEAIRCAFSNLQPSLQKWRLLDCVAKNKLCIASVETNLSAEFAIDRRGGLYLCQVVEQVSFVCFNS